MTDTGVNLTEKRLLSVLEFQAYTGIKSRGYATQWGKSIGAAVYIGRRLFFDRHVVDREVDKLRAQTVKALNQNAERQTIAVVEGQKGE